MATRVRLMYMWQYNTWNSLFSTLLWAQEKMGGQVIIIITIKMIIFLMIIIKKVSDFIWGIGEAPYVNPLENGHVPYSLLDPPSIDRIIDSFYTSAGLRKQVLFLFSLSFSFLFSFISLPFLFPSLFLLFYPHRFIFQSSYVSFDSPNYYTHKKSLYIVANSGDIFGSESRRVRIWEKDSTSLYLLAKESRRPICSS